MENKDKFRISVATNTNRSYDFVVFKNDAYEFMDFVNGVGNKQFHTIEGEDQLCMISRKSIEYVKFVRISKGEVSEDGK